MDPFAQVDNVLLPHTDVEKRKIERLGKVQRKRYLVNREKRRQELIEREEIHQEKRLQSSYARLFRVHLVLAAQEMSVPVASSDFHWEEQSSTRSGTKSTMATPVPASHSSSRLSNNSSHNNSRSNTLTGGGDKQIIEENLLKAHISLRAAFRAFHPSRMEGYQDILVYAHEVLLKLLVRRQREGDICGVYVLVHSFFLLCYPHSLAHLFTSQPPSSPEDGVYHHAVSGSAGPLPEAHIIVLLELVGKYDSSNRGESLRW